MPLRLILILCMTLVLAQPASAAVKNGFDLSGSLIPVEQILPGGPPKDGIPSIDNPRFVSADQADLQPMDRVLGLIFQGQARAYPIKILNWHEVVNDRLASVPVVITWCPLCGSGVAFIARAGQQGLTFGVSGLLYQSDVLLYDRQSQSLWSQLGAKAVTGQRAGTRLEHVPIQHMYWRDWQARYPATRVLSTDTGFHRDYDRDPYGGYASSSRLYFPVNVDLSNSPYHLKEEVIGLSYGGGEKAWPFVELEKHGEMSFEDQVGDTRVTVHWRSEQRSAWITDAQGKLLPANRMFWFAWYAFHPQGDVFVSDDP